MTAINLAGYRLTFDDEFNSRSISQTGATTTWADIRPEWRYDKNSDIGFGHSSFVDPSSGYDPFQVAGGALTITAVPDRTTSGYPGSWESGLIHTGASFAQTYGYYEIRADFSGQKGAWDAFWLMPVTKIPDPIKAGNWQELDVVEHYGGWDRGVYSTIHTTDPQNGVPWQQNRQVYSELPNPAGYHTYGMNWQSDRISFYVDGKLVGSQATPSDMHGPMYLIANLATQGAANTTNNADAAGVPISSSIDYIRVYSNAPGAVAVVQQTVSSPDGQDPGLYGATTAVAQAAVPSPAASNGAVVGVTDGGSSAKALFGTVTTDTHSPGGQVYALYDGLFGRAPDTLGLEYYADQIAHGANPASLGANFFASPEGQARFNAADNTGFVQQLYHNSLHRDADASGLQYYLDELAHGVARVDIAQSFVFSPEHLANLQPTLNAGVFVPDAQASQVARMYYTMLGRAPDAGGLTYYTDQLDHGGTVAGIAQSFLNSPENQATYGKLSNSAYVDALYVNALGRHAETNGLSFWTDQLDHGVSRADLAVSLSQSAESQNLHLAQIQQGWHLS
ncbi:DUF4214 domain-containing protein [Methylobacterium sp. NFXW15]|uniref:DUF4214 domain-containing protein n=1 Tax=Methylobacterium sp. NFXW15 TaxID=2819512 RepID=UPI003CFB6039